MIHSSTIVFLTGTYVSHACWDDWQAFFQERGYNTMAPPWPGKDADTHTLRQRHPDKQLASITIEDLLLHYISIIHKLPEPPIFIGHSFGGLLAQLLLNQGFGAAAVAIHATPPKGFFPYELDYLLSNAASLGFGTSLDIPYLLPFKKWQFAYTNGMPLALQRQSYEQLVIPESKRAVRDGFSPSAYVDFAKPHPPLLLMGGTDDRCIPARLCRRVFERYRNADSVTAYVEKKRNHFVLGGSEWREDAQGVYEWLNGG